MADVSQESEPASFQHFSIAAGSSRISMEEKRCQVDRVVNSRTFSNSPQLRKFLEYVANAVIHGCQKDIKEYTIGTEVLGRGPNFDPSQDTLVRTQASRLRQRLETFYKTEGASDEIVLEMPKGHYVPRFERRQFPTEMPSDMGTDNGAVPKEVLSPAGVPDLRASRSDSVTNLRFRLPRRLAVVVVASMLFLAGAASFVNWRVRSKSLPTSAANAVTATEFWSAFVEHDRLPVVSFSDHVYLMNESSDLLRYYGDETFPKGTLMTQPNLAVRDSRILKYMGPLFFNDDFTGTGEVYAVARLARVFAQIGIQLTITRSQLLSSADLNQRNVIIIGHPAANGIVKRVYDGSEFAFYWDSGGSLPWGAKLRNRHPQAGESAVYEVERDPVTKALRAEYSLVTFMPGITPERNFAVLAGVTTEGTRAGAEFMTSDNGIAQIASHLGIPGKYGHRTLPRFFQVVLRLEIAKSDILRIQYITGRALRP